jgi:hypothetical protein
MVVLTARILGDKLKPIKVPVKIIKKIGIHHVILAKKSMCKA